MKLNRSALYTLTQLEVALLLSLVGGWLLWKFDHLPLAITGIQAVTLVLVGMALPIWILNKEKSPAKPKHATHQQTLFVVALLGVITAGLAYGAYALSFALHDLSPTYIDTNHPLYLQATTLAMLILVVCSWLTILFVRAEHHNTLFGDHQWHNKKLLRAWGVAAFGLLNVACNPLIDSLFGTRGLDIIDWCLAIVAISFYIGCCHFQRHLRHHSRHSVLQLHREIHSRHK
jgi:hypothetical protein